MSDRLKALDAAQDAELLRLEKEEAKFPVRPDWSASPLEVSFVTEASGSELARKLTDVPGRVVG